MERALHEEAVGGEEEEMESIFALPNDYDKALLSMIIIGLIVITILYERFTDFLEESVFNQGIGRALFQKMTRELTVLGFVSFTATVILQFVRLDESDKQLFEYAHVLMFAIAVVYAKEIAIVSTQLERISGDFEEYDQSTAEASLAQEKKWWEGINGLRGIRWIVLRWWRTSHLNPTLHRMRNRSSFHVLRFHFMAVQGLLGKAKFEFGAYVTRSMHKHTHEIIEISMTSWGVIACSLAITIPVDLSPATSIYAWICCGWLLFLLEAVLLWRSNVICAKLIYGGHRLRLLAKEKARRGSASFLGDVAQVQETIDEQGYEENSFSMPPLKERTIKEEITTDENKQEESYKRKRATRTSVASEVLKIDVTTVRNARKARDKAATAGSECVSDRLAHIRMSELTAAVRTCNTPSLMKSTMAEMQNLRDVARSNGSENLKQAVADTTDDGEEAEGGMALQRPGGLELVLLPSVLQLLLIMSCMLQALVITLLGRQAILVFSEEGGEEGGDLEDESALNFQGVVRGGAAIVGMLFPTALMTTFLTPPVIKNYALAYATAHKQPDVLQELQTEYMQTGDYAAANQALELAADYKLSEEDLLSEEVVRAKVADLIKLGEMRWRYRVVDEGKLPRDEAISTLSDARTLISEHIQLMAGRASTQEDINEQLQSGSKSWSAELSEVCQGLALARLVHNQDRTEDVEINKLLQEALALREELRENDKIAETLNSLGSLRQKQRAFKDAEAFYLKSLELREMITVDPGAKDGSINSAKGKAQAVAQSLTSIGNLYVDMGENEAALMAEVASKESHGSARHATHHKAKVEHYEKALSKLLLAKEHYVKGFSDSHPKVAWALEGIARAYQQHGMYKQAQEAWEQAITIRHQLQESATGKQLFSNELEKAAKAKNEIHQLRLDVRSRFSRGKSKIRMAALMGMSAPSRDMYTEPLLPTAEGSDE